MIIRSSLLFCVALFYPCYVEAFMNNVDTSAGKRYETLLEMAVSDSRRNFLTKTGIATIATGSSILGSGLLYTPSPALASTPGGFSKVYKVAANSLNGKTVIITGGTTGLGLESAKRLAVGGATIILTSRTPTKGEKAVQNVKEYLNEAGIDNSNILSIPLDLDDLESVKAFPEKLKAESIQQVDVLMNNAGVMAVPKFEETKDGYERTFQSNHLGHFVLTAKLWPLLASNARIINVSSEAYNIASIAGTNKQGMDLENLNGEKEYNGWKAYGLSKLANIMFTQELQRRLDEMNSSITAVTLHPGAVNTDLARNFVGEKKWMEYKENGPSSFSDRLLNNVVAAALKTVEEGASTQIYLAAAGDGETKKGEFYVDYKPEKLPSWAKDEDKAKALWDVSEQLGGVEFKP